jgi:hypothetical protein
MRYLSAWFFLALLTAFGLGSANWLSYRRIAHSCMLTSGVVRGLFPESHDGVSYEYKVSGGVYLGMRPNPHTADLRVGGPLSVGQYPSGGTDLDVPRAVNIVAGRERSGN